MPRSVFFKYVGRKKCLLIDSLKFTDVLFCPFSSCSLYPHLFSFMVYMYNFSWWDLPTLKGSALGLIYQLPFILLILFVFKQQVDENILGVKYLKNSGVFRTRRGLSPPLFPSPHSWPTPQPRVITDGAGGVSLLPSSQAFPSTNGIS